MEFDAHPPLRRSARRCLWTLSALILIVSLLIGATGIWALIDRGSLGVFLVEQSGFTASTLTGWQVLALCGTGLVQLAFVLLAMRCLQRTFRSLMGADAFPPETGDLARRAAHWLWAALGWSILFQPISSLVTTWYHAPGERLLSIELGTTQLMAFIAVLLTGSMAQALHLAAALWQDHREIV